MSLSLISIKPSRKVTNRLWLVLSDKRSLPISGDDFYYLKIKTGDLVDEKTVELASQKYLLKNYGLNQIALSPKIKSVILPKLRQYYSRLLVKYKFNTKDMGLIDETIAYLDQRQLLSTVDFVQSTINRLRRKPRQYLIGYLKSKGVPESEYLPYLPNQDRQLLQNLLTQKKYQNLHSADYKTKNRLINSLLRKGFAYNDIKSLIDSDPID